MPEPIINLINASSIEYTPKINPEWFVLAIKKGNTLAGGYLRVLPNVTKDVLVKKSVLANNTVSQTDDRDCAFTPLQRINLTTKDFTVENYKINLQQCLDELDNIYSEQLFNSIGADKDKLPEGLEPVLMGQIQDALGMDLERIIWDTFEGNEGIVGQALADQDTIKVTSTTITTANVIGEIAKVYNAVPQVVLSEDLYDPLRAKLHIFVDFGTYMYLRQALSTTPTAYTATLPSYTYEGGKIFFMGVEIVPVSGLTPNTMVAASKDNLVFATDLLADTAAIKAQVGLNLTDNNIWYVKGQYRAVAGYIFSDELVIYAAAE